MYNGSVEPTEPLSDQFPIFPRKEVENDAEENDHQNDADASIGVHLKLVRGRSSDANASERSRNG